MKPLQQVAFIGNHLPRRCGIATFTHDIHRAIATSRQDLETCVVAMTDPGCTYDYPAAVRFQVREDVLSDYADAADLLNSAKFDIVSLQHEYGIFGGDGGIDIVTLLERLQMPVVTTLHTVLAEPTAAQRGAMRRVINASSKLVVMAQKGRELLQSVHNVPNEKIEVIPHGIVDFPFLEPTLAKAKLGFQGKMVILTFGLLSPSKGIENVIDALPAIVRSCPNAVYVILGATHPTLVRHQGEAYRESLMARVRELDIEDHVVFFNQFVDQPSLMEFISMCDVYVTPYLNEAQMTSGTLSCSFGLGKAVVSTPYWHANELLADGRGALVPFGNAQALGTAISALLTDDVRRNDMRKRAYADSRTMTWAQTAKRYLSVFEDTRRNFQSRRLPSNAVFVGRKDELLPEVRTAHLLSLCDSTGVIQHSVHSVPDRAHGYCVDDNARALLLSCALTSAGEDALPDKLTTRFAAFIQHAWNPDTNRFRNFMSYDRRWLEPQGSEDSHGRTLWALGKCASEDANRSRRTWAASLFNIAVSPVEHFSSPRAWAFTLLGLNAYCRRADNNGHAEQLRDLLGDRLLALFSATQTEDWRWFEDYLAYDNARLPQALIETGIATGRQHYIDAGIRSLRWLMDVQTNFYGHFRPVGSSSFGKHRQKPTAYDQQPVEAWATIAACSTASGLDSSPEWAAGAALAFGWFLGENDLRSTLIDSVTGRCWDGLHPDRPNENTGAESALSYLLGLVEIRQLRRSAADRNKPFSDCIGLVPEHLTRSQTPEGNSFDSTAIPEPASTASAPGSDKGSRQAIQAGD
ncbi:MAG: glycosyltransferase family 4 protein [Rhizobiales bacterium]|nr:glycosyltransferase family 4 protein [Hyphomicrobiales bacterium]